MSSLALVFALHHYKPTPLYFMDEIDAALDFKNVSIVACYIYVSVKRCHREDEQKVVLRSCSSCSENKSEVEMKISKLILSFSSSSCLCRNKQRMLSSSSSL